MNFLLNAIRASVNNPVVRLLRWILLSLICAPLAAASPSSSHDFLGREEVGAFVDEMVAQHGFDRESLGKVFAGARRQQKIIDAISRPAERRLNWGEYRRIFIQESRITQGVTFWQEHAETLRRAEAHFGVEVPVILAILGVETRFGRHRGSHRVLDALSTLAFDYPPRSAFFRRELQEFLLLAREEQQAVDALMGSYAGAMGYGQFIPSSYRAYAVDFDDDGIRDIWRNPVDAIGSIANYLKVHGWQAGALPAVVVRDIPAALAETANKTLELQDTVAQWQAQGVVLPDNGAVVADEEAALFRYVSEDADSGKEHAEYWLGLNNFYVITRYNRSRLYSRAVLDLAGEIAAAAKIAGVEGATAAPVTGEVLPAPAASSAY